jgi:Fe-S cluster assembly ATP-binding protein
MLKITNLNIGSGELSILEDINLEINAGEVHAILGPSCSGKSTLAHAILGHPHLEISSGKIHFKRKLLNKMQTAERSRLGIFLSLQYPPEILGTNNLQLTRDILKLRKDKRESTDIIGDYKKLIKEFDLGSEWNNRDFNAGSVGEKKKNELVQMNLMDPSLLILDQIETDVDPENLGSMIENVTEFLKQKGKACIIIAQDPKILGAIKPTHVHVIVNGKIVKSGDAKIIKRITQHGYREFS